MQTSESCKNSEHYFIALSGKRFSGKDYFSALLQKELSLLLPKADVRLVRQADELKKSFANINGLDVERLISDRVYKELHREEMTKFYTNSLEKDSLIWCRKIIEFIDKNGENPKIYILSDLRHKYELDFYKETLQKISISFITIRVETSDEIKEKRGWKFIKEVDEHPTENDLDEGVIWDFLIKNEEEGDNILKKIIRESIFKKKFNDRY